MVRRKNYLGLVMGSVAALAISCSGGGGTTDGGGTDTGGTDGTTQDVAPVSHSYTYVLDHLTIDTDDSPDNPHTGFNLDALFSGPTDANGCNHQDFFSMTDTDQNCPTVGASGMCTPMPNPGCRQGVGACTGGVDNQLPTLANTIMTAANMDIRTTLADSISHSKLALLVRVSGITDPADMEQASGVTVNIYLGYPTFNTPCTSVTAGQTYSVSRSSLMAGATSIDQAAYSFTGSIHAGRLIVSSAPTSTFNLPLPPIRGATLTLAMHAIQIRANITAAGLTAGGLGGWVGGNDIVDAVGRIAPDYCNVVRGAIGGLIDIQQNGICDDSSTGTRRFGGIGLGLGLTAVPAVISMTTPIADSQAPMTCSYTAPTDAGTSTTDGGTCH